MFKFSLSVRAYHTARRFSFPHWETWASLSADTMREACLRAGENVLVYNRGVPTAVELFRASGLGVYQIHQYIPTRDIEWVRNQCEQYDGSLHQTIA